MKTTTLKNAMGIILLLLLTSCQFGDDASDIQFENEDPNLVGMIQPADLSEETKRILNAIGKSNVHVFDLSKYHEKSYSIRSWIEIFENGVKQGDQLNFSIGAPYREERDQKAQVLHSYEIKNKEGSDERTFSIFSAIMDGGGTSSSSSEIVLPENTGIKMGSLLSEEKELIINQPVTLVTKVENSGNSMDYTSSPFHKYDETNEIPNEFSNYDRIILFRIALELEER